MLNFKEKLYQHGLISQGCSKRLKTFRNKLNNRSNITYATIGGSITFGSCAEPREEKAYPSLFSQYLNSHTECRFINAGIGATTSLFGAFRAQKDILQYIPDIITIEFAVNDSVNPDTEGSFENLVRQCVLLPHKPLVILIFTMNSKGQNCQHLHIPVGEHYKLPMLSYRDAVYPEIEVGSFKWEDISPDEVHPNNAGHAFIASMLSQFVETASPVINEEDSLPELLFSDGAKYSDGHIFDADNVDCINNSGWNQYSHNHGFASWKSDQPSSELIIRLKAKLIIIGFVKYAGDYGKIEISIDNDPVIVIDGFFEKPQIQEWGGGHTVLTPLIDNPDSSEHIINIKLLDEYHNDSNGHMFKITYFLTS